MHALFILSNICCCFLFFVLLIALRERWDDLVIKFIFCFFLTSKQIKTLVKLSDLNQEKQPEQHKSLILWRKKEKEKPGSDFIIEYLGRCEIITENNETTRYVNERFCCSQGCFCVFLMGINDNGSVR